MNLQRTGCLLLVAIVVSWLSTAVVHGQAQTQTPSPQPAPSVPLPERNPLRISPVLPKEVAPPHPREIETAEWSAQEVQVARDQCSMMLDGTDVVYRDLEPIREGVCGTPGPIELSPTIPAASLVVVKGGHGP